MPTVSAEQKACIRRFIYYWLIERHPITIKKLSELYALQGKLDFLLTID
jgi:hypothetical protein